MVWKPFSVSILVCAIIRQYGAGKNNTTLNFHCLCQLITRRGKNLLYAKIQTMDKTLFTFNSYFHSLFLHSLKFVDDGKIDGWLEVLYCIKVGLKIYGRKKNKIF